MPAPTNGRCLYIKDTGFNSGTNNITIAQHASEKIENVASSYVISTNGESVELTSDGTNWFILAGTGTFITTLGAVGSSPNANAASVIAGALILQPASVTYGGVVTTGAQGFSGSKTFSQTVQSNTGFIASGGGVGVQSQGGYFPYSTAPSLLLYGQTADSGSAVGIVLENQTTLSTPGAKIVSVKNLNTEEFYIGYDGTIWSNNASSSINNLLPSQTGLGGYILTTDGTNVSWNSVSPGYITALGAVGSSPNADAASVSTGTLTLQPASASFPGVVTTGTQSFAGVKTFTANSMVIGFDTIADDGTTFTLTTSNDTITDDGTTLASVCSTLSLDGGSLVFDDTTHGGDLTISGAGFSDNVWFGSTGNGTLFAEGITTKPAGAGITLLANAVHGGNTPLVVNNYTTGSVITASDVLVSFENQNLSQTEILGDGTLVVGLQYTYPLTLAGSNSMKCPTVSSASGSALALLGNQADGATAIGVEIGTLQTFSTGGAKVLTVRNNGSEVFYIDYAGNVVATGTISGGGGAGLTGFTTFGSSPNADGGSVSGTNIVLQPADSSHPGGILGTSAAQTLAPTFTFAVAPLIGTFTTAGVVHNSVTTGQLTSSLIVAADITNGTITTTQISSSAGIALTQLTLGGSSGQLLISNGTTGAWGNTVGNATTFSSGATMSSTLAMGSNSITGNWTAGGSLTLGSTAASALALGNTTGNTTFTGSAQYTTRTLSAATLTVDTTTTDYEILVTRTATGACTITLPAPTAGRQLYIKDAGFNAATNNITIAPACIGKD